MHFELHLPGNSSPSTCGQALNLFANDFIEDRQCIGYRPLYAWSRTPSGGDNYRSGFRLILLLDGGKVNSVAAQLRTAERSWALALGIDDASGLVGYYDRDEHGDQLGNGVLLHGDASGVDADWCDCLRWAKQLAERAGDRSGSQMI